jgi:hypothetical protein
MITMLLFGVGAAAAVRLRAKNRRVGKVKCMVGTVVTRWYFSRVRARTSSRRVIYRRSVLVYL